jgi:hypothetical protein
MITQALICISHFKQPKHETDFACRYRSQSPHGTLHNHRGYLSLLLHIAAVPSGRCHGMSSRVAGLGDNRETTTSLQRVSTCVEYSYLSLWTLGAFPVS